MRHSDRVVQVHVSFQQCKDEAAELSRLRAELLRRTEMLFARLERLQTEVDRLAVEYGV